MALTFQAGDLIAEFLPDAQAYTAQPLLERCEDFHQLSYGRPAQPREARDMPTQRPPGLTEGQAHLFTLKDASGALVGLLEGLRDHPAPDAWYLGLLLLAPESRGQGRGEAVVRAYEAHVRASGGRLLRLAVLEENPSAQRFWTRMGFQPENWVGPIPYGLKHHRLLRMTKALG